MSEVLDSPWYYGGNRRRRGPEVEIKRLNNEIERLKRKLRDYEIREQEHLQKIRVLKNNNNVLRLKLKEAKERISEAKLISEVVEGKKLQYKGLRYDHIPSIHKKELSKLLKEMRICLNRKDIESAKAVLRRLHEWNSKFRKLDFISSKT